MIITRDNYELFFLDYLEGKLEENMIDEFLDFLEQHPDLKEELHLFEAIELPGVHIVFSGKEQLYKSFEEEKTAFEIRAIALMEGDLRVEEQQSFEANMANHPELQKEYGLFTKTRLVADTSIQYPHKPHLYRKSATFIWLNWAFRAAAVVVILLGINALFQPGNKTNKPGSTQEIAAVKSPKAPVKKMDSAVTPPESEKGETIAAKVDQVSPNIHTDGKVNPETIPVVTANAPEREFAVLEEIHPILVQLEPEPIDTKLAVWHPVNTEKADDSPNRVTIDEYPRVLVARVKKAGDGGLLSANRIFRLGLNVASELSGDRISYSEKDGRISSLDFESKLMAFSIPLQKE